MTLDWSDPFEDPTSPFNIIDEAGTVPDKMVVQIYVNHTINKTDDVWIRPNLINVYNNVGTGITAAEPTR